MHRTPIAVGAPAVLDFSLSTLKPFVIACLAPLAAAACAHDPCLQVSVDAGAPSEWIDMRCESNPDHNGEYGRGFPPRWRKPSGLRVMKAQGPVEADLSCIGQRSAPAASAVSTVEMPANAFGQVGPDGAPVAVPGLQVQVFYDNRIPVGPDCADGCVIATELPGGAYSVEAHAGWLAYRVLERPASAAGPTVLRAMEVNFTPGASEAFNTVFAPVLDGLHRALNVPRDPEATLVAGRIFDCNGDPVEGATISLRDAKSHPIASTPSTGPVYLGERGPDPNLKATTFAGRWSVTNVPIGDGTVVVEVRAKNGLLVGCELAATASDALSVVRIGPLRSDAPAMCRGRQRLER